MKDSMIRILGFIGQVIGAIGLMHNSSNGFWTLIFMVIFFFGVAHMMFNLDVDNEDIPNK